ncbi:MAG: membrane protease subunit HflC [Spirochaetes bacterium]|nr:MAG: membrane protease subunit HflC [Spirochaetota bacterium]
MKKLMIFGAAIAVIAIGVIIAGPFLVINEGELAVAVRFGKIVKVHTDAGLKLKSPFIDDIIRYPRRVMSWDGEKQRIPTKENQFIWATARWRISDPLKFYESVSTLDNAYGRLDDVIDSVVRTVISSNYLREAVRNSDEIVKSKTVETFQTGDSEGSASLEELTISQTQFESLEKGREVLSQEMIKIVASIVPEFGIEVLDIVPRQIRYSEELTDSVYQRMIKERNQIAQAFRSYGEGKKAEWFGKLENDKRSILSSAYEKSETIKGKADAEATRIFAETYGRDASFFEFWKAMESYKSTIPNFKKTLSTDMDYFKYLYSPSGR